MLFLLTIIWSALQMHGDLFQRLDCVSHIGRPCGWERLWPGSDDSSKLSGCSWVWGIFVLILLLQMQISNLVWWYVWCLKNFFYCLNRFVLFLSVVDWNKIPWQGLSSTVNSIIAHTFCRNGSSQHPTSSVNSLNLHIPSTQAVYCKISVLICDRRHIVDLFLSILFIREIQPNRSKMTRQQ